MNIKFQHNNISITGFTHYHPTAQPSSDSYIIKSEVIDYPSAQNVNDEIQDTSIYIYYNSEVENLKNQYTFDESIAKFLLNNFQFVESLKELHSKLILNFKNKVFSLCYVEDPEIANWERVFVYIHNTQYEEDINNDVNDLISNWLFHQNIEIRTKINIQVLYA